MQQPKIIDGGLAADDRGYLSFVNDFKFDEVKRFYMAENHEKGFIRAWHGHKKESKYIYVVSGCALVALVEMGQEDQEKAEVKKFVLSSKKPQVLYVPSGYYNGWMNLEENTKVMFFSNSTIEQSKGDDYRLEYNRWFSWITERR